MFEHTIEEPNTTCSVCGAVTSVAVYTSSDEEPPVFWRSNVQQVPHPKWACKAMVALRDEEFPYAME